MTDLGLSLFAMSGQWHDATATRWMTAPGGDVDTFVFSEVKQRTLRAAVENKTVLLPLDAPLETCTPEFYKNFMRDQPVLLACDMPAGDTALVAIGVFVGEGVYANALDPALRVRGRRDGFGGGAAPRDANQLLAPVHVLSVLLQPGRAVTFDALTNVRGLDLAPPTTDSRLPAPLAVLVPNVQATLAAGLPTPQFVAACAVTRAMHEVSVKRTSSTNDDDRVAALCTLLRAMMTQQLPESRVELPPTRRAAMAAARKGKRHSQKTGVLLADAAAKARRVLDPILGDYDTLAAMHAGL